MRAIVTHLSLPPSPASATYSAPSAPKLSWRGFASFEISTVERGDAGEPLPAPQAPRPSASSSAARRRDERARAGISQVDGEGRA